MSPGGAVKAAGSIRNDSNPEQGTRRRGRPKGMSDPALRQRVVRAAYHLFVSRGFGRIAMDAVAAQCRMSKRTLDRLFSGQVDLFAAVVKAIARACWPCLATMTRCRSPRPSKPSSASISRRRRIATVRRCCGW